MKIFEAYQRFININGEGQKSRHIEGIYNKPVKNIIEFEKTLTVEEAIARSQEEDFSKPKINLFKKKETPEVEEIEYNNQILNNWKK